MHEIFFKEKVVSLKEYIVQLNGLDNKAYDFDFTISDDFFTNFENSQIKEASLSAHLTLTKKPDSLELEISVEGSVTLTCDRCLEEYKENINFKDTIFVEYGDKTDFDIDEDFVLLKRGENSINVAQFIYEFAHFGLPLVHYHPNDKNGKPTCNPEMLKILEKYSLVEEKDEENVDPWLSQLSDIKNSMLNN
ncbi:MAG TPA: DUF177 domain-containing protein [Bacteroidales bacterium]|nr:DUF177 domain-containing protein [Bacteroidales bacterium]HPL05013.1 DUF177 domain-containing protein [Bacteroidales bacterium]